MSDLINCMKSDEVSIIIIETTTQAVFGVFMNSWLKITGEQFYGSAENFLFTIYPNCHKYSSTLYNTKYINCPGGKSLIIGFDDKVAALTINFDLAGGFTYQSETYESEPLHGFPEGGQFKIKRLEAFNIN